MRNSQTKSVASVFILVAVLLVLAGSYFVSKKAKNSYDMSTWKLVTDLPGGFSYKVPSSFQQQSIPSFESQQGIDTLILISDEYARSVGVSGTVLTKWSINSGKSGAGCSIRNSGPKGAASSTKTVNIENISFYEVTEYDHGAGNEVEITRYVQPLSNGKCRFLEFRRNSVSGRSISGNEMIDQEIRNNNSIVNNGIRTLIPKILGSFSLL